MDILVIGSGGREHAIVRKLKESPKVGKLYCVPGNGGIARDAICGPVGAMDKEGVLAFAREHKVDFVFVAPDDPLAAGMVDFLEEAGFPCFGPNAKAAEIESSKVFSKNLMKKYGIPTAAYEVFEGQEAALAYIRQQGKYPVVIKADGLALGKGVVIAQDEGEAADALRSMMEDKVFGESGARVVVEEFLTGPEVTVLAFTDGEALCPMASSMDHKQAYDGDKGPNTGGMGTISPNPAYTEEAARRCMEEIFLPTVKAMNTEGRRFKGCLYFGLMLTPDGPKVIEYNCRFGDPETQVVLPLLEGSLLEIMLAVSEGRLADTAVRFSGKSACCVILASQGYPQTYEKGFPISLPETGADEHIYIAGAAEKDGQLVTSGGRVLGATAVADTLPAAIERAYALAGRIHFDNAYCRRDIGQRALQAMKEGA